MIRAGAAARSRPRRRSRSPAVRPAPVRWAAVSMLVTMSLPSCSRPVSSSRIEPNSDSSPTSSSLWNCSNSVSPWLHEAVADRVAVERAFGIAADVARGVAAALRDRAGDHRAVGGEDAAAADLLLLEQRTLVGLLFLQRLGVEDRPPGREADQDPEEDDDEGEQFDDLAVHAAPPEPAHRPPVRRPHDGRGRRSAAAAPGGRSWRRSSCRRS